MNMISRKVDERNEKIVRGLLKLPPNRRCINCDSLGPQYVCTNFWTFICTTCSGIHREFTHRVKSISMSKFTTEEVEALQNGGNQRAREIYLKGWDFQRQRLPNSSNIDKIREFIKNAYVDKKYIAAKVSDTPADSQSPQSHEEHKRASSYHSYSQSPPYDHQYEERKYGKRAPVLTRKPGSERSLHIDKLSSFAYSPTRMSEKANDNRDMNEGSISRHFLHSESSKGDPFRCEIMSPSSYGNHSFSSPPTQDSIEWKTGTFVEEDARRDVNKVPRPQSALSSGSSGSYGRNSVSSYSFSSNCLLTNAPEHQTAGRDHSDMLAVPSSTHASEGISHTLDFFANQVVSQPVASSTVDLFQLPATSTFTISHAPTLQLHMLPNSFQSSITFSPPMDYFGNKSPGLQPLTNLEHTPSEVSMPKNEGWATFDTVAEDSSVRDPLVNAKEPHKSDTVPFSEKTLHSEPLQCENKFKAHSVDAGPHPPLPSPWSDIMQQQTFIDATPSQTRWSAFADPMGHTQWESIQQNVKPHYSISMPSTDSNQFMNSIVTEDLKGNATGLIPGNGPPPSSSLYQHTSLDLNPGHQSHSVKYTNPFDLPFDSVSDANREFLNMKYMGAALPSDSVLTTFPDEFADPWPSPAATLPTSALQESIPYMAAQSQSSHFMDVSPHAPLASIGGNPFA